MPAAHLAQLERIDRSYWWHRVRWQVVRLGMHQYGTGRRFDCYYDVGSGGGGLPGLLQEDFAFDQIHLFDQHEVAAAKIRQDGMQQHVVDLESYDWSGLSRPQLITCLDVLEHLDDPARLLRNLQAKAKGRRTLLIVTVPAMQGLWSRWDEMAGHRRRYTRKQLHGLLSSAGWQVDRCDYLFSAMAPMLLLRRRLFRGERELVFPQLPAWLNWLMERVFWWEYRLLRGFRLPFGSSLFAAAHCD